MQNEPVLQRFRQFKEMFISSNIPNGLLLEMVENFLMSDSGDTTTEEIPILDGQLRLFDIPTYEQEIIPIYEELSV